METKEFKSYEIASIKRTAANVDKFVTKRNKLQDKIQELSAEIDSLQLQIDDWETPIKRMTGGYTTEDLINKEYVLSSSLDKNGNPIKTAKFVLKYPDTVIPNEFDDCDQDASEVDETAKVEMVEDKTFDPTNY